ncbi:hypothetical protein ANCDUO_18975, partial [Ancylostoma duodenale]
SSCSSIQPRRESVLEPIRDPSLEPQHRSGSSAYSSLFRGGQPQQHHPLFWLSETQLKDVFPLP